MNSLTRLMRGAERVVQNIIKMHNNHGADHYARNRKSLTNTVGFTGDNIVVGSNTILRNNPLTKSSDKRDATLIFWLLATPIVITAFLALLVN